MQEWWNGITAFERIFWYITIPASTIFLIQMVLTFIGVDGPHESAVEFHEPGGDGSTDGAGFNLLTLRSIVIFFTGFGWSGIFGVHSGFPNLLTTILAGLVGFLLMVMVAAIYYFLNRLTESGNLNLHNAVNVVGTVYLPIPQSRSGVGQVQLTVQGSTRELEAVTDGEALATGATVKVIRILNDRVLVVTKE